MNLEVIQTTDSYVSGRDISLAKFSSGGSARASD